MNGSLILSHHIALVLIIGHTVWNAGRDARKIRQSKHPSHFLNWLAITLIALVCWVVSEYTASQLQDISWLGAVQNIIFAYGMRYLVFDRLLNHYRGLPFNYVGEPSSTQSFTDRVLERIPQLGHVMVRFLLLTLSYIWYVTYLFDKHTGQDVGIAVAVMSAFVTAIVWLRYGYKEEKI